MKRRSLGRWVSVMGAAVTILAMAGVITSARADSVSVRTLHPGAWHLTATHAAQSPVVAVHNVVCNAPAHEFCVFQNSGCTENVQYVSAALHHSAWDNFNTIGVPYHPQCIANTTNSSVWVEDEAVEDVSNACAAPGIAIFSSTYQAGWFFVKYNIGTCGSEPSGE